jgi:hypothetical protein
MCGRWWRTMTATTQEEAQVSLDRFWATTGDARLRPPGRYADPEGFAPGERPPWPSVGELADQEQLMALPPMPYPATIEVKRTVDDRASVAFRGNRYSTLPGLLGAEMTLRHRLGTGSVDVVSPAGAVLVTHTLARAGAGSMIRTPAHRGALERAVLAGFSTARPCDRKANRPPGTAALAARAELLGAAATEPTVDLEKMAEVIRLAFPATMDITEVAL